jgi:hypothetical protein
MLYVTEDPVFIALRLHPSVLEDFMGFTNQLSVYFPSICPTCPTYLTLLDVISLTILG